MKPLALAFVIGIVFGYYVAGLADAEIAPSPASALDTVVQEDGEPQAVVQEGEVDVMKTVIDEEYDMSFMYRRSPDGYVLSDVSLPKDGAHFVRGYRLVLTEDEAARGEAMEGPPSIDVLIFENKDTLAPRVFAETFNQISNIEFARGEVTDVVFNGAPAIRYMSDGLYTTDTTLVSKEGYIYLFAGSFAEEDSLIRDDYLELIDSVELRSIS